MTDEQPLDPDDPRTRAWVQRRLEMVVPPTWQAIDIIPRREQRMLAQLCLRLLEERKTVG
jgi:hypothetical protein